MTRLRSICFVAAAAALLMGCGGKSSSGPERLQLNSFVARAADTMCSALAKCGCGDSSAVTSCKQAYTSDMTDWLDYQVMAYPGRTIDPVAAQACLDGAKAELADCSLTPGTSPGVVAGPGMGSVLPGCDGSTLFKPLQTAGDPCSDDAECVAGLACDHGLRTCGTPAALNGDCTHVSCVETAQCSSGTCLAKLAAGDTCSWSGDAWRNPQCGTGLECYDSTLHGHSICAAPVAIDGTCGDGNIPCVTGAYCDNVTHVCKALVADGGTCTADLECTHRFCNSLGKCADPGICAMPGLSVM